MFTFKEDEVSKMSMMAEEPPGEVTTETRTTLASTISTGAVHTWLPALFGRLCDIEPTTVEVTGKNLIPCHMKVTEGFVYLLGKGVLFLTKTTWFDMDLIARIEIGGGASHTFNMQVGDHFSCSVFGDCCLQMTVREGLTLASVLFYVLCKPHYTHCAYYHSLFVCYYLFVRNRSSFTPLTRERRGGCMSS